MATTIAGYQVKAALYESANSLVYRAYQEAEDRPVVLKMLKQAYPSPEKIGWFQREYELTRSLQLPGVVRTYSFTTDQHSPVMVLEDFGGESLELLLLQKPLGRFSMDEFLPIAIQMADILGQVHQQHVMHKDINPSNIIFNPVSGQLKLIDFGISTVLPRENPTVRTPGVGEGTLAYMSPEQTGRMNRSMDYRTDLYSLGITFHELLTGQLPFLMTDPMALMHAHLAQQAISPHEHVAEIPRSVSAIVMRLMAKNAEDRYQSASGLRADLEACVQEAACAQDGDSDSSPSVFPLGQHDVTDHFSIPQKLYGRQAELETLLTTFEQVSQGVSAMLLVTGQAGIGKSALVHEIYKPMTHQHGYFIAGKFDQLQRNIPYAAFAQAFRALIRLLLAEREEQLGVWREKLLVALGPNAQLIIDIIPELELLIDAQPPVPSLPPTEAQNRLHLVLQRFLQVFPGAEHSLTLFLDDLQWADGASVSLLQRVMTASETQYLFVIGAYRENEVSSVHPLQLALQDIQQAGRTIQNITLGPLAVSHVNQIVAETLHCPVERAEPLAELIFSKTNGNPFFVNEFLQSLYQQEFLAFDFLSGQWQWELAHIQAQDMTDNVVTLMTNKVQALSEPTQRGLQLAACIGHQFDLHTLAVVSERSPRDTAASLWAALQAGLITPLSDVYKLLDQDVDGLAEAVQVTYRFVHDRIQQAAYSLIPDTDKQAVHWQIGQLLLHQTPTAERESRIFDIVNQLNLGLEQILSSAERIELAELNLRAGRRAKAAAAYEQAYQYVQLGVGLLGNDAWLQQYNLSLALHVEAAEVAYLNGDFDEMTVYSDTVLRHALTVIDKVKAYTVRLFASSAQDHHLEALATGREVLALLGIHLPEQPSQADILRELEATQQILAGRSVEELGELPEMTDPEQLAAIRILLGLFQAAYSQRPELYPLIVFRIVNLSVQYGNAPLSARGYAGYGMILCSIVGDIDTGYRFGQLALDLLEKFDAQEIKASTILVVHAFVTHWKDHIKETLQPLLDAYRIGLETGDVNFGALAAFDYIFQAYWMGKSLTELEPEMAAYSQAVGQLKQVQIQGLIDLYRQVVANLRSPQDTPDLLVGQHFNEEQLLPFLRETHNANGLSEIFINKMVLCYLFGDIPNALAHAKVTEQYLDGLVGTPAVPVFYFYDALSRLACYTETAESERQALLERVASDTERLQHWARAAPMNYAHKLALVEAERARVDGALATAREAYDRAIDAARAQGYVNEEALANELAAKFYLACGRDRVAAHYLRDAHYAYLRWGAVAKVKDLERHYPQLLEHVQGSQSRSGSSASTSGSGEQLSNALDFASVLSASQAISGEIVFGKLLDTLMKTLIENAGAQKGLLVLEKDGQLWIEAEKALDSVDIALLRSVPVETRHDIPLSVIRYVERTGESVVLNDATQDGLFTTDPYILSRRPQSILCAPVIHHGKVSGIIYLENNLATGAFIPERVEVVSVLASQAAISLESARLYEGLEGANAQLADYSKNLERRVEERTQELQAKNHELEEANHHVQEATQRKSQFLAGMSHELRTPLNSIIGFSEVLLEKMFGQLNEKQEDYLQDVVSSGRHLLSLINDILDLSKVEAGRMELELGVFNLKAVLEGSLVMVRENALAQGISLSLDIADDIDTIIGDERKVKQILFNLLSNAVKFTPDTGKVGIQAGKLGDAVRIAVWDTGVGIAREDQGRIFEEFQQAGRGLVGKPEGTGLGLALAKQFVEMHAGSIWVESMPGVGSTFSFLLPLEGPGPDAQTQAVLEESVEEQRQIGPVALIVEDDPKAANLLQIYLAEAGYLVEVASDGTEGLRKITQRRPDVIILDILLPQVDGWAFLTQLKKDPATQAIPVIIVSIVDERSKGIALGAAEYLVKPVRKEELLGKLKTLHVAAKKPTS